MALNAAKRYRNSFLAPSSGWHKTGGDGRRLNSRSISRTPLVYSCNVTGVNTSGLHWWFLLLPTPSLTFVGILSPWLATSIPGFLELPNAPLPAQRAGSAAPKLIFNSTVGGRPLTFPLLRRLNHRGSHFSFIEFKINFSKPLEQITRYLKSFPEMMNGFFHLSFLNQNNPKIIVKLFDTNSTKLHNKMLEKIPIHIREWNGKYVLIKY